MYTVCIIVVLVVGWKQFIWFFHSVLVVSTEYTLAKNTPVDMFKNRFTTFCIENHRGRAHNVCVYYNTKSMHVAGFVLCSHVIVGKI